MEISLYNQQSYLRLSLNFFLISVFLFILIALGFNETYSSVFIFFLLFIATQAISISNGNKLIFFFSSLYFFTFKIYNYFNLSTLNGPDSYKYYEQTKIYHDYNAYISFALKEINIYGIFDVSSFTLFGVFYMPLYTYFNIESEQAISLFNSVFAILTIFLWVNLIYKHFDLSNTLKKKILINSLVILLFTSACIMHWSSSFLKDMFAVYLSVYSFSLFMNKKYFGSIIVLIIAIAIRPYAIIFIFCYWLIFNNKNKIGLFGIFIAATIILVKANVTALINVIPMTARILILPNPLSLQNWESLFFSTLESTVISLFLLVAFINYLTNPKTRNFYHSFIIALVVYACTLTLLGYSTLLSKDMSYDLWSAGDDMFRKKLPFMLITYTMIAYTIATFKTRIRYK